jgi:hypothetical protein
VAPGTDVVVISYRAPTSARAAAGALAVADATLTERAARVQEALETRTDWLDTAIGSAEGEISAAYTAGDEAGVAVLTRRLALLRTERAALEVQSVHPGDVLGTTAHRDKMGQIMNRGLLGGGLLAGAALGWLGSGWVVNRQRRRHATAAPRMAAP